MIMDPAAINAQREADDEILYYVREVQNTAPVVSESVMRYLTHTRRRKITDQAVELRLDYLVDSGLLKSSRDWQSGKGYETFYEITAKGSDVLDGVIPRD